MEKDSVGQRQKGKTEREERRDKSGKKDKRDKKDKKDKRGKAGKGSGSEGRNTDWESKESWSPLSREDQVGDDRWAVVFTYCFVTHRTMHRGRDTSVSVSLSVCQLMS